MRPALGSSDAAEGLERSLAAHSERTIVGGDAGSLPLGWTGRWTEFQHAAERWFDDSMERVSGWYRRKVQLLLFVIAT